MHKCTYIDIYTYINTCIKPLYIARHFENNIPTPPRLPPAYIHEIRLDQCAKVGKISYINWMRSVINMYVYESITFQFRNVTTCIYT